MVPSDFAYAPTQDVQPLPLSVTIMSDSDQLRTDWCEDADMAGLALAHFGPSDCG